MAEPNITEPITITLPDDPLQVEGDKIIDLGVPETPAPAAVPAPVVSDAPEDGIEHLRQQLARRDSELQMERDARLRAEGARADAERAARDNAGRAEQFRGQAAEASYDSVVNALGATQQEIDGLQGKLADAMEKADFAGAAKLNADIAKASAKLDRLEDGKLQLDQRRQAQPQQQPVQPQAESWEQFNSRPWNQRDFDYYVSSRTPRTAAWLRAHPEFASDLLFRDRIIAADGYARKTLGVKEDSDDYFRTIETALGAGADPTSAAAAISSRDSGQAAPVRQATQAAPVQQAAVRTAVAAAPPSRSVPTNRGNMAGRQITLSEEERRTAHLIMPPKIRPEDPDPEVAYAQQKAEAIRSGRMTADGRLVT